MSEKTDRAHLVLRVLRLALRVRVLLAVTLLAVALLAVALLAGTVVVVLSGHDVES